MMKQAEGRKPSQFEFLVYPPPAEGLPWLAVSIGLNGNIFSVEAFDTPESAAAKTLENLNNLKELFDRSARRLTDA